MCSPVFIPQPACAFCRLNALRARDDTGRPLMLELVIAMRLKVTGNL